MRAIHRPRSAFRPRLLAAGLALAMAAQTAAPGGLENFYDSISAYHNATAPQAIHAQAMRIYTGGSLFTRTPNKTYQLWNVAAPSIRAGCGGIDIFGGSFSFINADEFVQILRNIGQNALGLLFMTALKSLTPEIADIIEFLQAEARAINSGNINSCEEAQKLVAMSGIESMLKSNNERTILTANLRGIFSDYSKAREQVGGNDAKAQQTQNAIKNDPDANAQLTMGNLVWRAMKKGGLDAFLSEKELRMAMSVTGAVIFARPPGADPTDRPELSYYGRTLTFDRLMGANTPGADQARILSCLDGTGEEACTVLGDEPYDGKPFSQLAYEKMMEIHTKIVGRARLDPQQIAFVEATSVPVYRMLAVAASLPSDSIAIDQMLKNSDVIGAELASAFLMKALDEVEKGLNSRSMIAAKAEVDALNEIKQEIQARRQEILTRKVAYTNKVNSISSMMQEVAFLEKSYMGNLSDGLAANLRFSRAMRMNGG